MRSIIACTGLLLAISVLPVAYSRQITNERLRFAETATRQLSNDINEHESIERRELIRLESAIQRARQTSQLNAQRREQERSHDMAQARVLSDTRHSREDISREPVTEREVSVLRQGETSRVQEEQRERAELQNLENDEAKIKQMLDLRESGKFELQLIQIEIENWKANPTDAEWRKISNQITALSTQQNTGASVVIITKRDGAFIKYQNHEEHDNNGEVHSAARSTNNVNENMAYGEYFIWAEREGRATSNKNAFYYIGEKNKTIEIEEIP